MKTTIGQIHAEPGQRVIVMSDIHGHAENFLRVLQKAGYGGNDILVIVGDVIDKGPESLRALRCLMRLAEKQAVYVSMGNVDLTRLEILLDESDGSDARLADVVHYQQTAWGGGLVPDMLREAGADPAHMTAENAAEMRALLCARFAPEIAFLRSRPAILTMGNYIFVHGGVPTDDVESLAGTDAFPLLKNDSFYTQGHCFSRCVMVGHWPTALYRSGREDFAPLIDCERRIVCLDGGCSLKAAGQLNAVILPGPDAPMEQLQWTSADSLPTGIAQTAQEAVPPTLHFTFPNGAVERLGGEKDGLIRCRHIQSGRTVWLPEQFLYRRGEGWASGDYVDARLAVQAGDTLSAVWRGEAGIYAKRGSEVGWYTGAWKETPLPPAPALEDFL